MTVLKVTIQEGDTFTGVIKVVDVDEDGEAVPRGAGNGFMLSSFLAQHAGDRYSLGSVEMIFDFDDEGRISQIEIYT